MRRVVLLVALVGCAAVEPISSRMVPQRWLEFSSRALAARPFENDAPVSAVAFGASGDRIVTGTAAGELRVFDLEGRLRARTRSVGRGIKQVALIDGGTSVSLSFGGELAVGSAIVATQVTAFATDGRAVIYPETAELVAILASGRVVGRIAEREVRSLAVSKDGKLVALLGKEGASVREVATGRARRRFRLDDRAERVALLPGGGLVIGASHRVVVWDEVSQRPLEDLDGTAPAPFERRAEIWAVAPDGAVARASFDGGPAVSIDRPDGTPIEVRFPGDEWTLVTALAFSPDGRLLAVTRGQSVLVVDARTGETRATASSRGLSSKVVALGFTSRASLVGVGAEGRVVEWSVESGNVARGVDLAIEVRAAAVEDSGRTLVGHRWGVTDVWGGGTWAASGSVDCAVSPGGRLLASLSDSGGLAVFDRETTGTWLRWWPASGTHVAFSADGRSLATYGGGALRVFDIESGSSHTVAENVLACRAVGDEFVWLTRCGPFGLVGPAGKSIGGVVGATAAFSPRGDLVALMGGDEVPVHDTRTGSKVAVLRGHARWVTAIAFDRDEKTIATGDASGAVRLWELPR